MSMSFDPGLMSLEELDEFLMSDDAPDDCMMLSDLDGFLTAVAIGPELILPSEWLPVLWCGESPGFQSEDQAQRVLGAIMGRYNEILDILAHEPEAFEPILYENRKTGETIAADWAEGFLIGVQLRAGAWKALFNSEDALCSAPIAAFTPDKHGGFMIKPEHDADIERFRAEAGDLIPEAVRGMYRFFRKTRGYFQGRTKLGRNDPCFCGSGKKFKKCCGARRH